MNLIFDIGGMSTKYAIFNEQKQEIFNNHYAYGKLVNDQEIIDIVLKIVSQLQNKFAIENIAIASPGIIDCETGGITGQSAIENYHHVNWIRILEPLVPGVVKIENDAKCAALAELHYNQRFIGHNAITCVIGTGIGGAVIINRQVYKGTYNMAGELGCIVNDMNKQPLTNTSQECSTYSMVQNFYHQTGCEKTGIEIFELYEAGDKIAIDVITTMVNNLTKLLINMCYVLDPDTILIGGSISQNKTFFKILETTFKTQAKDLGMIQLPILLPCKFTNKANLYGALSLL